MLITNEYRTFALRILAGCMDLPYKGIGRGIFLQTQGLYKSSILQDLDFQE